MAQDRDSAYSSGSAVTTATDTTIDKAIGNNNGGGDNDSGDEREGSESVSPAEMLLAGRIDGVYGIKGWVKIFALTDPVDNFLSFKRWFMRQGQHLVPLVFTDGRRHGKGLIACIKGVDDRTQAEKLRGTEVWVHPNELPVLDDEEFYWHQLQGLKVWSSHEGQRVLLGAVDHLLETGANDVLVLRACEGSVDDRERLIPYLPGSVVQSVDLALGELCVDWHPDD